MENLDRYDEVVEAYCRKKTAEARRLYRELKNEKKDIACINKILKHYNNVIAGIKHGNDLRTELEEQRNMLQGARAHTLRRIKELGDYIEDQIAQLVFLKGAA